MDCRLGCGACCIAPSITSAIPGMPDGKPAGVRCIQLSDDNLCMIFGSDLRPIVCGGFSATVDVCGTSNEQAMWIIADLESSTS